MRTAALDYALPPELIAQEPVEPRDASRLMVVDRRGQTRGFDHRRFADIGAYLRRGDLLVANDTRVIPGRLWARRPTGGGVELLLLRSLGGGWWAALARPARRLRPGMVLTLLDPGHVANREQSASARGQAPASAAQVEVGERTPSGGVRVRLAAPASAVLARYGQTPLPPYIQRPLADPEQYQTVYSRQEGSAAAPTAGRHFTPALMDQLRGQGVQFAFVTLHIGPDTFRPIRTDHVEAHRMHAEYVELPAETAQAVNAARSDGRRIIAVGTTAVRVLEATALAAAGGLPLAPSPEAAVALATRPETPADLATRELPLQLAAGAGWTALYITPGHRFRAVDALITNFHLPRSTLLALVSAFAGRSLLLRAYAEAIRRRYRFYSFGDAMLIL